MRHPAQMRMQVPVSRPTLDKETHPLWYNPKRLGVEEAPGWFMERVHREFGNEIAITRNPLRSRWMVWRRDDKMQHPACQGWRLLFVHQGVRGEHLPLDERLLMRLEAIDMQKQGGAKAYFDRIMAEAERDKAARERQLNQDTMDIALERGWDHSRISVSMRGQSDGSKFSKYHA